MDQAQPWNGLVLTEIAIKFDREKVSLRLTTVGNAEIWTEESLFETFHSWARVEGTIVNLERDPEIGRDFRPGYNGNRST